jgi:uncharacterized protein with PIN domain
MPTVNLRFYEELNDHLPPDKRKVRFSLQVGEGQTVREILTTLAVPSAAVDLILINQASGGFDYRVQEGDTISLYPVFEALDISSLTRLPGRPLRKIRFLLDAHLGRLARYLRMCGFDARFEEHISDSALADLAQREQRILLTRDRDLLNRKNVTHGYFVRSIYIRQQMVEVLHRFDLLDGLRLFTRCLDCNQELHPVEKAAILHRLPPKTKDFYGEFLQCPECEKVYWEGPHQRRMLEIINEIEAGVKALRNR